MSQVVEIGQEVVWDYQAISDEKGDPLISTDCLCGLLAWPNTNCGRKVLTFQDEL